MLLQDNGFYSHIDNHDVLMMTCAMWVEHYNFLMSIPWNTDADKEIFEEEMREHLCYDV
jgi:hypothetical protein